MIEIGTSYERAQTSAFKTTNAIRDAIALMGMFAPKMGEAIMASMMASRDGATLLKHLLTQVTTSAKRHLTEQTPSWLPCYRERPHCPSVR